MFISSNFRETLISGLLCMLIPAGMPAQVSIIMVAPDTSVVMNVTRVKGEIFIELNFSDNFQFASVELQRRPDFEGNFSRFGYVGFEEVASHCGHVVKKDNYPYHDSADVFYRLKVVLPNGKERIYNPVMLQASVHGG